jgi:hypothetical protein
MLDYSRYKVWRINVMKPGMNSISQNICRMFPSCICVCSKSKSTGSFEVTLHATMPSAPPTPVTTPISEDIVPPEIKDAYQSVDSCIRRKSKDIDRHRVSFEYHNKHINHINRQSRRSSSVTTNSSDFRRSKEMKDINDIPSSKQSIDLVKGGSTTYSRYLNTDAKTATLLMTVLQSKTGQQQHV